MAGQRFRTRLAAFISIVAGFLTLFVLTLALTPRAEAFVYWSQSPAFIGRANLDGSSGDNSFTTTQSGGSDAYPVGVDVDGTHIYWANSSTDTGTTIGRANLDGTGVDNSFITGAIVPLGVAVDRQHIYWTNSAPYEVVGEKSIGRANLDGTGADQSFVSIADWPGSEVTSPAGVAVDDKRIYWSNSGFYGRTIGRANLDGTDMDPNFIRAADDPRGVAVDGVHIYWANIGAGTIGRAALDGTNVNPNFITGAFLPRGVAVDGEHIYWSNEDPDATTLGGAAIGRANIDGTGVDQNFIPAAAQGVAVDALRSFSFGNVKRNKQKGTARLGIQVAGPGEVVLAETDKVKPNRKQAEAAGKVKLPIKPRGEAKKRLNRKGKAKVEAEVTYTPTGADSNVVANTDTKTVKLIKG